MGCTWAWHCRGAWRMLRHPTARSSWLGRRPWMELHPKGYSRTATFDTCHANSLCIHRSINPSHADYLYTARNEIVQPPIQRRKTRTHPLTRHRPYKQQ